MNDYFQFRQFRIHHDRCAMKVGTDGVLLGAWAPIVDARSILDIGTGSGLVALMVAQRNSEAKVVGVDVDADSVAQAEQNVKDSPYSERVSVERCDVREYALRSSRQDGFDAIVCNPPFYTEDTLPPESGRAVARNSASLPFTDLIGAVSRLLNGDGVFSVVLPFTAFEQFSKICLLNGLHPVKICRVKTVERKAPKRILAAFKKLSTQSVEEEELVLQEGNQRSPSYANLCRDFYL